jgi:ribosome-binding protein aMBF1 (putative translation factor)
MVKRRKRAQPTDREISDPVRFAAEITAGRAVLGWSQTELALRTAVTQRAIHSIRFVPKSGHFRAATEDWRLLPHRRN